MARKAHDLIEKDGVQTCTRCNLIPLWTHALDGLGIDPHVCYPPLCLECGTGDLAIEACPNAKDLCVDCCGDDH